MSVQQEQVTELIDLVQSVPHKEVEGWSRPAPVVSTAP